MARSTHVEAAVCLLAACLLECGMVCARTVDVPAGKEVTLDDALSGTEDLVKTGGGTLVLAGSTSGWTGPIDVREGTLSCSPLNMGATGDLRVCAGAKILFTGTNVDVPSPTRKGYLAGTVAFASGFSYASNSWYVFKDAVLEDDLVLEGGGNFVGWGDLDMGGHVLSMGSGSISLPRMSIRNFGTIRKTAGGGLHFTDIKTTDFGSGGTVELCGDVTLYMRNSKGKTQFAIHSISGLNWIDAAQDDPGTTSTAVGDYTFAGPIQIDAGSTLQTWSYHDGLEVCVIEGAITGGGVFSTAEQARTQTVLRGDAEIGPDVSFAVNAELRVEPERVAAFAGHAVTIRGGSDLVLVGATTEQLADALAHVSLVGGVKGRVHLELPGEGEHVYNGPFETGKLVVSAPAGSVMTTDPLTDTLLGQIFAAYRNGAWYVGGDPSAASTIGNTYYRGHIVLRDAGDVRVDSWICALSTGLGNVKPDRFGLRGETRLTASGIWAGRGGVNGCGIVEIEDGAEAVGTFWVGQADNDRGGLYQRGGRTVVSSGSETWAGLGASGGSNGCWIQRGGTNEIMTDLYVAYEANTYGAYLLHDGLVQQTDAGSVRLGTGGRAVFYQDGGVYTNGTQRFMVNIDVSSSTAEASFTLDGKAEFRSPRKEVATWSKNSTTRYNLNGGLFETPFLYLCEQDYGGYDNGVIHLGFNGGTWRMPGAAAGKLFCWQDDEAVKAHPTSLTVYEGGATLETCGFDRRAYRGFDAPTGLGVKSVALPEKIGGVAVADLHATGPLKFFFVGGNGSADALVDFDDRTGKILGVKVLSSGFGYAEAPKAYVVAPWGTVTNECAVEMFEPKGGGLTKKGAGVLWLDKPNTYTGRTRIEGGTLRFSAGALPPAADIEVCAGATFWPEKTASDNVVDTLRGTGTGWYDVTVTNRLVVSYADALAGRALRFREGCVRSQGAKVVLDDPAALTARGRSVTVLTAENGLDGDFVFELPPEATGKNWKLVKTAAGTLRLLNQVGMVLVVR